MKLTTHTHTSPDSDGDTNFEAKGLYENKTEHTIEMIKTSCLITNSKGVVIHGSDGNEEDTYIEPNDSEGFDIQTPWGSNVYGETKMNIIVDAQFYRREFHDLGEVSLPDDHTQATYLERGVDIGGLIKIHGVTIFRGKPDEDDNSVEVGASVGIRNVSEINFDKVIVKLTLMDQEGAVIETDEYYETLSPKSGKLFSPNIWGTKKGKLKNSKVKVTLFVYQPVDCKTAKAVLEKG